jgi:3-hydroxyisobutyrate dehydrogenase
MATTIAVLGTGIMGAPIARNLAAAGFDVRAWNRTRARAEPLAADGVAVFDEAAEAVAGAEIVITMLSDGDAVSETMTGEGALEAMDAAALWIQASTVGVDAARDLMDMAAGRDITIVDAPVLGTRQPAEQGELIVLASGPDEARVRCAPVFDVIGKKTVWLGEAGAGSRMKLVVNAWLLALVEGLAESIALAEGIGADPRTFLEIIDGGPMGPPYAKLKGTAMIEESFDPAFTLALAAKDARLVAAAALDAGLDLPLPGLVAERMQRVIDAGHGDEDMAATVRAARPASERMG